MRSWRCVRVVAAFLLAPLLGGCWKVQDVQRTSSATFDFPDPGLLYTPGRYYRYATNSGYFNVPMQETTSGPYSGWTNHHDAMPGRPSWSLGNTWGPEVHKIGDAYYLYYSATEAWDGSPFGRHAIGVAASTNPRGPFVHPYDCCKLVSDWRGVIDPEVVFSGGQQYLLWSVDWGPNGRGSSVQRQIVAAPMHGPWGSVDMSKKRVILSADRNGWERGTVEAPAMVWGAGRWNLFYSGGNFESDYAVGYAICGTKPTDPCSKVGRVWRTGDAGMVNPGGTDFIPTVFGLYIGIGHGKGSNGTRNPWMGLLVPQ